MTLGSKPRGIPFFLASMPCLAAADGPPHTGQAQAAQAAPTSGAMSPETCKVMIGQHEREWTARRGWSACRADRTRHRNRDGVCRAATHLNEGKGF